MERRFHCLALLVTGVLGVSRALAESKGTEKQPTTRLRYTEQYQLGDDSAQRDIVCTIDSDGKFRKDSLIEAGPRTHLEKPIEWSRSVTSLEQLEKLIEQAGKAELTLIEDGPPNIIQMDYLAYQLVRSKGPATRTVVLQRVGVHNQDNESPAADALILLLEKTCQLD